jgi:ornithine cyclodeaminase
LILSGNEVASLLHGREGQLIEVVRDAYKTHARGASSLPHSSFLGFPTEQRNRIIALPAYLGGSFEIAGLKWVSSFPGNLDRGMDRASAVVILNSPFTGRLEAIVEGSGINAKRTAASAALAARHLQNGKPTTRLGVIGCGPINFEVVRFLLFTFPEVREMFIFDLDRQRAEVFKHSCQSRIKAVDIEAVNSIDAVLESASLISFATTAIKPHVFDLSKCAPGSTILHVSLRDLAPEVILASDNIADDVDHVCRAQTSLHLTEQQAGNRKFIRCALPDILLGNAPARKDDRSIAVFSPFGLGILDLAVGKFTRDLALQEATGTLISSFPADSWYERDGQRAYEGLSK